MEKLGSAVFKEGKNLGKNDYVLVAGDLGVLWDGGKGDRKLLEWVDKRPFTTLFIDGNHENFDLLNAYPVTRWCGGQVHQIGRSLIHLMRGQVFILSNMTIFTFGGAASTDREWRKEQVNWWPEEMPSAAEMAEGLANLEKRHWEVDVVITHTAPTRLLGKAQRAGRREVKPDALTDYLDHIYEHLKWKKWLFGHFHTDQKVSEQATAVYSDFVLL
jgi:DNA repair exonuclease SbcCD nuclease subunit